MSRELFFGPDCVGEFLAREAAYFSRYARLFVAGGKFPNYEIATDELNNAVEALRSYSLYLREKRNNGIYLFAKNSRKEADSELSKYVAQMIESFAAHFRENVCRAAGGEITPVPGNEAAPISEENTILSAAMEAYEKFAERSRDHSETTPKSIAAYHDKGIEWPDSIEIPAEWYWPDEIGHEDADKLLGHGRP